MNTTQFSFDTMMNELFRGILRDVKTTYKPPEYRCTLCESLMSPVPPEVKQFGYYEVHRKDGWSTSRARVCCEACMSEYERQQNFTLKLPKRYSYESGYVYLLRGRVGYKIGETEDLKRRKRDLDRQHNEILELIHTIKTPHSIGAEKYFHYRYGNLRIDLGTGEREWFNLSDRDVKYIKSFTVLEAWRPYNKPNIVVVKLPWN